MHIRGAHQPDLQRQRAQLGERGSVGVIADADNGPQDRAFGFGVMGLAGPG